MARETIPGFPERLRELRIEKQLTAQELADAASSHIDTIFKLERGKRSPTLEMAWRLAQALGVPLTAFLPLENPGGKIPKNPPNSLDDN